MARLCECCGKMNNGFKGDPLYLEEGKILCCKCAEPISNELSQMYEVETIEELDVLTNSIIEKSKLIFREEIMNYMYLYINKRRSNVIGGKIEKEEQISHSIDMFNNVGGKIKALAQFITWVGIIVSIILGIVLISGNDDLMIPGLVIMVVGSLCSWISSFILYGFGQLVENSDKLVHLISKEE